MQLSALRVVALVAALAFVVAPARAQRPEEQAPPPAPLDAGPRREAPKTSPIDAHVSSDVAAYADTDHVYVFTPSVAGSVVDPAAGWRVDGSYLVDVVSAASVDIVSTASRRWTEVRHAGTLGGAYKPGDFGVSLSGSLSREPDYLAWSGGGQITQDLADKNVTLLAGFTHGHDVAGRGDTPFSVFSRAIDREGFKAGVTVVVDRATVASVVGDLVFERGDASKPYRYVPMFAPGTAVPVGASIDLVTQLRLAARPLEQLPLARDRGALSLRVAHRFARATLRLDERLYRDSWSLSATSTDARLLFDAGRVETGPHARLHAQTAVSFWQRAYVLEPGHDFPALRTGDRELGPLVAATGGWTLRLGLGAPAHLAKWVLGWDLNVTETRYLDDLYITDRVSVVGGMSVEGSF